MRIKYEIAAENDSDKIEKLNKECTECFEKLNGTKISFLINDIFQNIITDGDSGLILWKLSQDLQVLTNELGTKETLKEQANDKYSIEILWRELIHVFDAPPHGNFPKYRIHNTNSNPDHCCCCSGLCTYEWEKDVWGLYNETARNRIPWD